jgi:hypothetical protein
MGENVKPEQSKEWLRPLFGTWVGRIGNMEPRHCDTVTGYQRIFFRSDAVSAMEDAHQKRSHSITRVMP